MTLKFAFEMNFWQKINFLRCGAPSARVSNTNTKPYVFTCNIRREKIIKKVIDKQILILIQWYYLFLN